MEAIALELVALLRGARESGELPGNDGDVVTVEAPTRELAILMGSILSPEERAEVELTWPGYGGSHKYPLIAPGETGFCEYGCGCYRIVGEDGMVTGGGPNEGVEEGGWTLPCERNLIQYN